jgi:protocatechuate 3,4-dioxygenase beta subunit
MIITFTKILAKTKITSLAFLLMFSLQFLQIAKVSAQASNQRVASTVKITNVEAIKESRIGLIDGKIVVTIEDLNTRSSSYRLSYDLHSAGNNFISPVLTSVNNKLTLSNVRMGNYYNLKVIRTTDNIASAPSALFKVDNAPYVEINSASANRLTTVCGSSINYNDCNGVSKSISNCNSGSGYNDDNAYRPCGIEVSTSCSVFSLAQWHCIDGNLSTPPNHNEYTPTDYVGAGLTALKACRINWIVCHHACFDAGVDQAIWFTAGTGGTNNSIAQAAVAAVPVANGTESLMTFYKSNNGSYQDMVQWNCKTTPPTSDCTCTNGATNLLTNASFENGTTGWSSSGGSITTGTGYIICGAANGFLNWSAGTAMAWQQVNAIAGNTYNASAYLGTHTPGISCSPKFYLSFYNAAGTLINRVTANVTTDVDVSPFLPSLYSLSAVAPAGVSYLRVETSINCNTMKMDAFCLTTSGPVGASIGDYVWNDGNGNGIQDAGELGLSGVQVQLKNSVGTVIATTTSNASGFYQFTGLAAGTYTVQFLAVAGFGVSPANVGTNDAIDSDVDGTGAVTVILTAGQSNQTIDAGFCPTNLCIGNLVWSDANNNGLKDAAEVGISGVTVNIYQDANNDNIVDGAAFATAITNATGNYSFCNLAPGNYIIGVVTPIGSATSAINSGDPDDNIDNDNNGVITVGTEVRGFAITISGGAEPDGSGAINTDTNNTYDFGFYFTPVPLTLGNKVFDDKNRSGLFDAGDGVIVGATVRLYLDANNDNIPDGAAISTTITDANGNYSFINLNAGNYIVGVVPPVLFAVTVLNGGDPDNNIDNDNNGISLVAGEVRGNAITLASGTEPEVNANNTYDIGLYNPSLPPNGGEGCFTGTNPVVYAKSYWNVNANSQTVTMRVTFAKTFVDNTYGTSIIGWPGSHAFSQLTGSDHLQWSVKNGAGVEVLAFKQDYMSASALFPSGYGNLGFGGDGGNPTAGLATDVLSFRSSLTSNFNDYGYIYTTNSPTTDANYSPNATAPNWIYEVWYEITVKASTFGASGFGFIDVASVHASPSKTGNNTEAVTNTPCPLVNLGNVVWNDQNKDGIKQTTETGIAGVTVKLYVDANNDNVADVGGTVLTTTTDANGLYNFAGLAVGNYIVGVTIPNGYAAGTLNTADPDNNIDNDNNGATIIAGELRSNAITLTVGGEPAATVDGDGTAGNLTLDFALKGTASIGDFVFNDANANGIQDASELGISGVTVVLTFPNGGTMSTTTDANGNYTFADLAPGTNYTITFTTPAGYNPTTANAGTNDAIDSDPIAGTVTGITVTAGQTNTTIDAGFFQYVNLGNTVWYDQNNDGIKQATETGISNVTVKLYLDLNNDNIADGLVFATTTTDANGVYNFANLIPGNYIVGVMIPNGYAVVTINGGDPDNNIDNDNNGINTSVVGEVRSNSVMLTSGLEPLVAVDGDGSNGNLTVDFALRGTGSIGDFVFNDTNGNGIQDVGELGIAGATVVLTNPNGTTTTVITDANGNYSFSNLAPGTYSVAFTTPAGYTPTAANVGANDAVDSDPIGGIVSVVLTAGQLNTSVDAGFYQLVNLGNTVWYDQNNDGIKQANEVGISAVTVKLYADVNNDNIADATTPIFTTITDASGLYSFANLAPGNYIVGVSIPSGYAAVTTNGGDPDNNIDNDNNGTNTFIVGEVRSSAITLIAGTEPSSDGDGTSGNLTVDFALRGTGVIGDFVFNDVNGNGIQDAGEVGIPGAIVVLTYPNGTTFSTTTDANGLYSFPNLAPGTYSIAFTTPNGLTGSPANQGGDPTKDSNPVGGVVSGIVLTAGQLNTTVDAGFFAANVMNLGNVVWYDQNNNGIKDASETGIAGVTVNLYADANNDNTADGAAIATITTDINGLYNFGALAPSNYIVGVIIPTGYAVVTLNGGDPDNNTDNDNNGTNTSVAGEVRSNAITLSLTSEPTTDGDGNNGNLTLDFGFRGTGSIGDFVFNDANGNGIQDAGETGIAGATVVLTYPNGTTVTTVTDANGNYTFANLAPGTYSVAFTTPSGLTASPANQGGDPTKDSNPVGGVVSGLVITPGQLNTTVDAGFFAANVMSLGNTVWYDQNNDGIKQATETGIAGATVKLYADVNNDNVADGVAIATTTTDANGLYNFAGLVAGNYIVGVNIPTGYAVVTTNGGDPDNNTDNDNNGTNTSVVGEVRSNAITLALTTEPITDGDGNNGNLTLDFGLKGTGSIGDFVFNDANGNGIQDAGESGIPNVIVSLSNPNGTTTTTTTDANGNYIFANLAPGTYSVTFTTPSGLTASPSNVGADDTKDSDPIGGTVSGIVLAAGQLNTTVDAGFFAANVMNLGNVVWYDQNNDGTKQATETGIAGATVKLYADANNDNVADGAAISTTTTDASGMYNFGGLAAGNYIVGVNIPSGYAVVTLNGGDPDNNTDNDNNGTNTSVAGEVRSSAITLALTTEPTTDGDGNNGNLTLDFGFRGTASIGNFVFNDLNANGVQDVTEVGLAGVTVTLTNLNGTTTVTTSDANGLYTFANLAPGTYSVAFTTPAGFNVSPSNVTLAGATDANDSDPIGGVVNNIVLTAGQVNETVDAGFYNCVPLNSGINGPLTICAGETAVFNATGAGSGSIYTWTFMNGNPATATGVNVSSTWSLAGEYDINLTVTKNGCTSSYLKSIVITQSVFANAGPDNDICSGSSTTLNGSGPLNSTYSWVVISGDPTSIDNGANASSIVVSPLSTTTYQLTVSQNGCTKIDQVTVFINVNKNPIADAGANKIILLGSSVAVGGSPSGTAPPATPGASLGYIWSPTTALNSNTNTNPVVTPTVVGTTNYRLIVYSLLTACSDTSFVNVTAVQPVNLGNSVWYDKNNNGIKDAGEPGVATTVNLYEDLNNDNVPDGAAIATTTTTGNGVYNFTNLFPGSYIVGAIIPNGYSAVTTNGGNPDNNIDNDNNGSITTAPGEVRTPAITLTAGGEPATAVDGDDTNGNLTLDIALTGNARLGNFIWEDANRNGVQDANEAGIANATVKLTYPDGGNAFSTTNAAGAYSFDKLVPGSYDVEFITPAGYTPTISNVTGGAATDANDSDPINGFVSSILIAAGDDNGTIDAGFYRPISINGNVWHDVTGLLNNQIDNTPGAIAIPSGLNVYLINDATGLIEQSAIVANNGTYSFLDVSANTSYRVIVSKDFKFPGDIAPRPILPSGWIKVGENLGAGPNSGSDGVVDGILFIDTQTDDIFNANFGIKLRNGEVVIG